MTRFEVHYKVTGSDGETAARGWVHASSPDDLTEEGRWPGLVPSIRAYLDQQGHDVGTVAVWRVDPASTPLVAS